MNDNDKRIAAIHVEDEGRVAAVWLSLSKVSDVVTLYDACIFEAEVPAVIMSGLNARGRWIPIAWEKKAKDVADEYQKFGCNMLYEPVNESPFKAQMLAREIDERMRSGRFKVEKRLGEWLAEFELMKQHSSDIQDGAFPLMSATRYAIAMKDMGRRMRAIKSINGNAPKVAMI